MFSSTDEEDNFFNILSISDFQSERLEFLEKIILTIFSISLLTLFICYIVITLASLISKKTVFDREKNSPYECGFDPKGSARFPFSLRFFLIAVIFLIFDVEITLLLPLASIFNVTKVFS